MIIVEQEKTYLVNFNNVSQITLAVNEEENEYAAIAQTIDKEEIALGVYGTEERVKEVLQEIQDSYCAFKILPFMNLSILNGYEGRDLKNLISYQMPKE